MVEALSQFILVFAVMERVLIAWDVFACLGEAWVSQSGGDVVSSLLHMYDAQRVGDVQSQLLGKRLLSIFVHPGGDGTLLVVYVWDVEMLDEFVVVHVHDGNRHVVVWDDDRLSLRGLALFQQYVHQVVLVGASDNLADIFAVDVENGCLDVF